MNTNIVQRWLKRHLTDTVRWDGVTAQGLIVAATVLVALTAAGAPVEPDSIETVMQLAGRDQYEAAVELFEKVKQQHPDTIESIHGHKVAVVYAVIGDRARHEAHCRWLMDRYRDAEQPTDAERSVKGYLLFPSAEDPTLLEHALERTSLATEYAVERGEGVYLHWFEGSRGMAEYRSGNYAEAVAWLEKAAKSDNIYINSLALPFKAMAEFARGNRQRAETVLEQARNAADSLPAPGTEEYFEEWTDTLTTQFALREAEQLIAGEGGTQN